MEEFTNDKAWKSDLVCQKNISPNDICGSSSGNFASGNGKSFVLKMMTYKNTQLNEYYRPFLKDKYFISN